MRGVSQFIYKLLKKHVEDKKIKILKKKDRTNGNEETSQEKGGRAGIDERMFILQKAIRLRSV